MLLGMLGVFAIYVLFHGLFFSPRIPLLIPTLVVFILAFLEEVFFCGYAQNIL